MHCEVEYPCITWKLVHGAMLRKRQNEGSSKYRYKSLPKVNLSVPKVSSAYNMMQCHNHHTDDIQGEEKGEYSEQQIFDTAAC